MRQGKYCRFLQEVARTADVDRGVDIQYLRRLVMRRLRGGVTTMAKSALYRRKRSAPGPDPDVHIYQAAWQHWLARNRVVRGADRTFKNG
jgi:hypothetical protein